MEGKYEKIIEKKKARYEDLKNALAEIVALEQKKEFELNKAESEIAHLTKVKNGAGAKAKSLAEKLRAAGKTDAEIMADSEVVTCHSAFKSASETLADKEKRSDEMEASLAQYKKSKAGYLLELKRMQQDYQKIKEEKSEAIADVIIAKEQERIDSLVSGMTTDSGDKDLQELRDARHKAKAKAAISREIAGSDARLDEAEYLEFEANSVANSEFASFIGLDSGEKKEEKLEPAKLSE